jgi:hypothetical protein
VPVIPRFPEKPMQGLKSVRINSRIWEALRASQILELKCGVFTQTLKLVAS